MREPAGGETGRVPFGRLVFAGGGTAGWMLAAALRQTPREPPD